MPPNHRFRELNVVYPGRSNVSSSQYFFKKIYYSICQYLNILKSVSSIIHQILNFLASLYFLKIIKIYPRRHSTSEEKTQVFTKYNKSLTNILCVIICIFIHFSHGEDDIYLLLHKGLEYLLTLQVVCRSGNKA
jgi:multisubunit Na+/H+ antiporter MnhG subunit